MNLIKNTKEHNLKLTKDEQNAYQFLSQSHPEWSQYFIENINIGRDKVTQRLVTSIHRENLVHGKDHSRILKSKDIEALSIHRPEVLEIEFKASHKKLYAPISGQHAFNRVDVEGPFYYQSINDSSFYRVEHPNDILEWVLIEAPELDNEASDQFKDDLTNSAANMIFAISYQAYSMKGESQPLFDIIKNHNDSYLRSEQAVIEGHPLHPGAKLRKGMDSSETFKYSPEFAQPIDLKIILIHHQFSKVQSLDKSYNDTINQLFPSMYQQLLDEIKQYDDINIYDYHVMIVHPWQYDEVLDRDYSKELDQHMIIKTQCTLPYYAGLSFRTLMPKAPNEDPHIKLSTNVHITGEIRTLSEQTTHNGPLVTHILNQILVNDTTFKPYASSVIDEVAGIHFYNENDLDPIQTERSEQLGTLFRTNINTHLKQNGLTSMIPSSLVAQYPYHPEPPIVSLIKLYQSHHKFTSYDEAALTWMKDYSHALLGLVVPLLTKYGIALEAHLQNAIVHFNEDGSLNHLYVRDFEGLRIDQARLNDMGYATDQFHEKSRILTESKVSVFNKAFYSTVQNHLGELILTIVQSADHKNLEDIIWNDIANIIHQILDTMTDVPNERISEIQNVMFAKTIDYKCVTTMRLEDEAHEYTYIKVNNPLHS
ncbi:sialic acid synthase [Staphylococcus warneri]|jgi:D-ornithine---citrate ligase|uniref:Sialic acid synthase n=2 Tax=Staphylococcus TaxID=1279 RepID=A0A8B2ZNT0_STAWA|nr:MULTISPECIES: IucA/IucC family protein [Staphylococcus]EGG96776.1 siderophore biosynthesis protein, IucA/IucC family [Staphylococcus warneri VCU121]KKI60249.1 Siderophore biosynthesis protein [Staphylococcus warneri]KTW22410.1 sialic acid synthase [Staphylococcus warneri]MBF2178337.1 sialic acid synthase [Staphylococcus warneri]MBF2180194.1 sialic acid synthase [Staphylococcus warneri]